MIKKGQGQRRRVRRHLVVDLQLLVLRLGLQQRGSVDERLGLDRVVVLQVQPGDLQVRLQLVLERVLPAETDKQTKMPTSNVEIKEKLEEALSLLSRFQRDADEDVGGLAPALLALVDVGQVLAHGGHLLLEGDDPRLDLGQGEAAHRLAGLVVQLGQVAADLRQDLPADDQADVFVDDCGRCQQF